MARAWSVSALALVAAALCAWCATSHAHGSHSERHREIGARIARTPGDALLYIERAEVYREDGHLAEAHSDLARAAALAPGLPAVALLRARLDLDRGEAAAAGRVLDSLLVRLPRNGEARLLRAEALEAEGRAVDAADQIDRALPDLKRPTPDHYLDLARLLVAAQPPRIERAATSLERGIALLGPAPGLIARRVELAMTLGRSEEALAWHDRLEPFMSADPAWLARRGELLEASRRTLEALAAFTAALEAIEALPPRRRAALADTGLEAEVRARLQQPIPTETR